MKRGPHEPKWEVRFPGKSIIICFSNLFLDSFFLPTEKDRSGKVSEGIEPVVGFRPGYQDIAERNKQIGAFCNGFAGVNGIGSLSVGDVKLSLTELNKCATSDAMKAFALEVTNYGAEIKNNLMTLFGECAGLKKPVVLCADNSVQLTEALVTMVTDGLLDFYPTLEVIVMDATVVPALVSRLTSPDPSTSLQKHEPEVYFGRNMFFVWNFADIFYTEYLLKKVGCDNLLLGYPAPTAQLSHLEQLHQAKVVSWNGARFLGLADVPHWPLDRSRITVFSSAAVNSLSSILRDARTGYTEFMVQGDRLMRLLAEEALARLPGATPALLESPTGVYQGVVDDTPTEKLCVVSIVRSGDILLEAFRQLRPGLKVGKILIQRDEGTPDKRAVFYYKKLPGDICQLSGDSRGPNAGYWRESGLCNGGANQCWSEKCHEVSDSGYWGLWRSVLWDCQPSRIVRTLVCLCGQ
eukprot:sb/3464452/